MNECIICYKDVNEKSELNLICQCKYIVHNSCYRKWYKNNKTCIICREYAYPPNRAGKIKLLRDIKNFNVHDGKKTPLLVKVVYSILLIIICYYVFLKERINTDDEL